MQAARNMSLMRPAMLMQHQNPVLVSMLTRQPMLVAFSARTFGYSSRYVGPNDMIRQERKEKRKYGMKRHFYDREILDKMDRPVTQ